MNPRNTWRWIIIASCLFAASFLYHRFGPKKEIGPMLLLPGFRASETASVEIIPANQRAISVLHTNGHWQLIEPFSYPAQATNVEALLTALQQTIPAIRIPTREAGSPREADEKFGFDPPATTLVIQPGDQHIQFGNRTAPGDQVFVKVVGTDGIFVVGSTLLNLIPHAADEWRETTFADFSRLHFDRLLVTSGAKPFGLERNPTDGVWRINRPLEARADNDKIEDALNTLQKLRAQFVADGPNIDFDSYGLQTPDLTLTFLDGTNTALSLAFGKSPTNDADRVYARRNDEQTVVTVARDLLEPWRASYETLRDRHLVSPTGPLAAIEIHGREDFTVWRTNFTWFVTPQNFVADNGLVTDLLKHLAGLEVAQFYRDVVIAPDLPALGLSTPSYQLILCEARTNAAVVTNVPVAEIDFGTNQDDLIFARRADEKSVYQVRQRDFAPLPQYALDLRNRRIWHFSENDVAAVTIHQHGKTLRLLRGGTNQWSVAPGSQGMIPNEFALEETVHRFGELAADYWIERGDKNRERYGFKPDGFRIEFELKDGRKRLVEFGGEASIGSPFAIVTQDGEPWVFTFPPVLNQYVQLYMTIPPGGP